MKTFNFTFTEEEANIVINAVAAKPYGEVFNLMNKIQQQIQASTLNNITGGVTSGENNVTDSNE